MRHGLNAFEQIYEALLSMVTAETNGTMKRDALCGRCLDKKSGACKHEGSCWVDKVMDALAVQKRQCDKGTAEEQSRRFTDFCYAHRTREKGCGDCPVCGIAGCELAWGQMPYK